MMGLWGYGYTPCMGTGLVGFILMILFWIFIMWVLFLLVRGWMDATSHGHKDTHDGHKKNSAVRILEERYAKGEIDKKELEEKMNDLTLK